MNKVLNTPYLLLAAAMVGLGDTLYLAYYHMLGVVPGCAIGGCEVVLTSPYAEPWGIPLAYLGVVYYAYMFCLAVLLAIDPYSKGLRLAAVAYTGIGLLCSIGFELLQLFVIGALCLYCGISALTTLALFAVALWHWRLTKR